MIRRLLFELRYLREKTPWDTGISPPELLKYLAESSPGYALDLGCGTGTNAITMTQRGWQVVGVDLSALAIRTARRNAHQAGFEIDFRQEDVTRLASIKGPFDFALDSRAREFAGIVDEVADTMNQFRRLRHQRWPAISTTIDSDINAVFLVSIGYKRCKCIDRQL